MGQSKDILMIKAEELKRYQLIGKVFDKSINQSILKKPILGKCSLKTNRCNAVDDVLNPEPKSSHELFDVKSTGREDHVELITQFSSKPVTI